MASLVRLYFAAVMLLIVLFSLMLTWEWLAMSRTDCSAIVSKEKNNEAGNRAERDAIRNKQQLTNFTWQMLKQQSRPLLVRFDWYSRKKTPIHQG